MQLLFQVDSESHMCFSLIVMRCRNACSQCLINVPSRLVFAMNLDAERLTFHDMLIDHSCVHVLTCRVLHARGKCAYMCQNTFCQAFGAFSSSICVEDCLAVFQGWAVWCVLGSICCDMLDLVCCDMYVVIEVGFGGPCLIKLCTVYLQLLFKRRGTTCERI